MSNHVIRSLSIAALFALSTTAFADDVQWSTDIEGSLLKARQSNKLVLMKFTADWCVYCKKMERETFTVPQVAATVNQQFVPILVDADQHKALTKHLQVSGLPAVLVVSPEMIILERISGYKQPQQLMAAITPIAQQHYAQSQNTAVAQSNPATQPATRPVSSPRPMQTAQLPPTAAEQSAANPSSIATSDVDLPSETQAPEIYNAPAFGGLCLAGVRETRSLISGMPQLAMQYRGRTLYFSSPEQQQNFRNDPSKYWPEQDGICPVSLVDSGEAREGKLEFAAMYKGRLWVTSSESAMQKFVAEPARYATAASHARQ